MPKQIEIPGTEAPRFKDIDAAAEAYVKQRDKVAKEKEKLSETRRTLIASVHKNEANIGKGPEGELVYRYDDMVVTLKGKETVAVKIVDLDGDDED